MPIRNLDTKAAHADMGGAGEFAFVDVRTIEEYEAGHPEGSVNVPWAVPDPATGQMAPNPDFLPTMQKHFAAGTKLYLSCAAGVRSLHACHDLESAGYSDLCSIDGGFMGKRDPMGQVVHAGWVDSGLPVEHGPSQYHELRNA